LPGRWNKAGNRKRWTGIGKACLSAKSDICLSARPGLAALWLGSARIINVSPIPILRRRLALRGLFWAGLALSCGHAVHASALTDKVVYEGETFDRRIVVAGLELQLNGLGVRQVAWFKGYLAALYLATKATNLDQALAAQGAKRIQLRILHDVPATELAKAVRKGILLSLIHI
jgi:hypothetical protein